VTPNSFSPGHYWKTRIGLTLHFSHLYVDRVSLLVLYLCSLLSRFPFLQLHGVEKLVDRQGLSSRPASNSNGGGFMSMLCGRREADITPAEYRRAREALTGLRNRWQQLASDATREAAPRQTQRFHMTSRKFRDDQDVLRLQVCTSAWRSSFWGWVLFVMGKLSCKHRPHVICGCLF
jgi:hypothetical protein